MKHLGNLIGTCLSAAILTACGGANSGFSSSTPMSVAPQIGAPGAMQQSAGIAASESAAATRSIVHRFVPASSYRVLYRFRGAHGVTPYAGLLSVNGTLYGTTDGGGANGYGSVFSITTTGKEKVVYSFGRLPDALFPTAGLINVKGTFYGTTEHGGTGCSQYGGCGTVFSVTATGIEKVLYSFSGCSDGAQPEASLINVNGVLYSTTFAGGNSCYMSGRGTVFSITTTGTEKVLHQFKPHKLDGSLPLDSLINVKGTLYGTTVEGGDSGYYDGGGTVFSVSMTGKEEVVYSFGGGSDGAYPKAALIDVKGTLYGTTYNGGSNSEGTVFTVSTSGTEKVLYRFGGPDGANPVGSLISVKGTLYGTTYNGGADGYGTVFSISTDGAEKVLHSFSGDPDGAYPYAGLTYVKGTLYGTTTAGGAGCKPSSGCGTVFAFTP
jgi:uncharacterized repeat protein (TIGR03803 family)